MACHACHRPFDAPPAWRKVLFERQPFADNYVDSSFMAQLVTNANVTRFSYWTLVHATLGVTQRISGVVVFFVVFLRMLMGEWGAARVGASVAACALAGGGLLAPSARSARTLLLFAGALFVLSPVLRSLTETYSDDTIYALAISLSALHLALHDYSGDGGGTAGAASLNAAVFASVLLASRLGSDEAVFAFLFFAVGTFVFLPLASRRASGPAQRWLTAALVLLANALLGRPLSVLYSFGVAMITFGCPLWLVSSHKYKFEIQGPWDIAHVAQL